METKKEKIMITKQYLKQANKKWKELVANFYIYESVAELASNTIWQLFEKDIFDDVNTYYKKINGNFKFLCELEENIYFQFDIYWATGIFGDTGMHINNGKFRIMNNLPKGWQDIYGLIEDNEE